MDFAGRRYLVVHSSLEMILAPASYSVNQARISSILHFLYDLVRVANPCAVFTYWPNTLLRKTAEGGFIIKLPEYGPLASFRNVCICLALRYAIALFPFN
jgi:hypothetical protein